MSAVDNVNNPRPAATTPPNINGKLPLMKLPIAFTTPEFFGFEKKFRSLIKNLPANILKKN